MISLSMDRHEAITALARAGEAGLLLGDEIATGAAIDFTTHGFATITPGAVGPQRAVISEAGKAFAWRTAA